MDVVQQPEEELLCIVLSCTLILLCCSPHHLLEARADDWIVLPTPQTLEQESELLRHVGRGGELGAVLVEVTLVGVRDEVLGQLVGVTQALEYGVHEAGVAVVVEPAQLQDPLLLLLRKQLEPRRSLQLVVSRARSSLEAVYSWTRHFSSHPLLRPPRCGAGASRDCSRQPVPLVSLTVSRGSYVFLFFVLPSVLLLAESADEDVHERTQMLHLFLFDLADVSFQVLALFGAAVVFHTHGAATPALSGILPETLFSLVVQQSRVRHVAIVMLPPLQAVHLAGSLLLVL